MGLGRALAQPVGASVVAGQAQVSTAGATTLINQSTAKAIINWQDFSVAAGASVQFNQPSTASITLNRVTGANISNIEGAVRANGQVWLLNPNGVLIGNNARINVGGLLATTSDIANQDFIEGRYNFSGGRNSIINKGAITASSGGSVVLSAPTVINHGLIQASAGHVVLGGTDTFTVDFNGDHLLSYAVGANSTGGKVTNTGKISAPGGTILLTAKAAAGVQDAVINNTGMVEATSVREENGEIILEAEDGGVANSGTLDASGKGAGETGGTVKVLGKDIAIADDARIDVSGDAGGGTALIGGNFQGKGSEQHAQTATVGKANIKADAISRGNGGKVAVWSDGTTRFAGAISAHGGAASGNGGQVETSGHTLGVAANATVDTSAAMGFAGNWLLDPDNIDINSSGGCTTLGGSGCTDTTFSTTGDIVISPFAIQTALSSGNVTLQANLDITVNSAVSTSANNTLELDAGRSIILNAGITLGTSGGNLVLYAGNPNASGGSASGASISSGSGVTLTGTFFGFANGTAGGAIGSLANPIQIFGTSSNSFIGLESNTNNGDLFVQSASPITICGCSSLATAGIALGTGNLTVNAAEVAQNAALQAHDVTLSASNNLPGNLTIGLGDTTNAVSGTLRFTTTQGNVDFTNSASITTTTLGSSSINGDLTVTALGQTLNLTDSSGQLGANNVTLSAANLIDQAFFGAPLPIVTSNLTATASNTTGSLRLFSSGGDLNNAVTGTVTLNAGSSGGIAFSNTVTTNLAAIGPVDGIDIEVSDPVNGGSPGINVNGTLQSTAGITLTAAGDITLNSAIATSDSSIALLAQGSLILNANVTDTDGTVFLAANYNPALNSPASITGTGTVSAASVAIQLGGLNDTGTGSVGTSGSPLLLNLATSSDATALALEVSTGGQNVFLNSQSAVNISSVDSTLAIDGVNLSGASTFGNFNLAAAGQITQDSSITANDLTVSTTGSNNGIVLSGNTINGTSRFNTDAGSDVSYTSSGNVILGNSNVGRDLTVNVDGDLSIRDDVNNVSGAVVVSGNASLTAGGDIAEGTSLHNAGYDTNNYIPIISNDLTISAGTAGGGNIALTNPNNVISGTLRLSNQVGNDYGTQVVAKGDVTLGAVNLAGDFSLTVGNGGGITLADDGEKVQADNISLTADGDIVQDLGQPLQILTSGNLSVTSNFGDVDLSYSDNIVGGTVALNAAGNASFINSVDTTLIDSSVGGSLYVITNDDSQSQGGHSAINISGLLTVAGDTTLHASGDITNFNSDDSLTTTGLSLVSENGIIGSDGAIRLNGYLGGPVVIKDIETNGMDASLYSTSAVSVAGLGEGVDAVHLAGGIFSLGALGDITVDAPIRSIGGLIHLDTTGNIAVNADITAEDQFSGSGAVWLTANDGNLGAGTADNHGISSAGGTVTASYVTLNVGESAGGISGGIGSLQNQLHLDTFNPDSNDVSVSVKTYAGDVFLNSAKGISFDLPFDQGAPEQVAVNLLSDPIAPGLSGSLFVNAAGAIDQTYGIQVRDLTLNTTGSDGFITLSASSCGCGDPGNQIDGVVRITTEQADAFLVNDRSMTLGNSDIHGQAQFIASDPNSGTAHISVDDPNGGTLRVQGHLTLYADTDIQGPGAIETGDGLDAQAFDGSVSLVNPANAVQGGISLTSSETGSVDFANSVDTEIFQLGGINSDSNPAPAGSITVTVRDSRGLTHPNLSIEGSVQAHGAVALVADGDITLASGADLYSEASGDAITLAAAGHFINQVGASVLSMPGGGRFLIYSADPAGDTFGQLNSNNTAIFGTAYPAAISAAGNRYVFAQSARLTVTATDATKTYGVDNSAALAAGYTITTEPLSVGDYSEAFLPGGNDASFSGVPLISSLGAGSGANVGVYDIVASLGSLQLSGYQVVFQNAHLTVTPATLSYAANAVSRIYGGANPAFSGSVSGFVNGDTLASATSGNLVFASAANAASGVGLYAINGSGLNAANYVFVQAAANNTALTIAPATLVYLANMATRAAGDANPAFSGSVSGFVNGETLASATSGLLVFTTNAGLTSVPGSYAINGSGLSAANYVFVQAPGNATALTITAAVPITPVVPPDTGSLTGDTKTALMGFIVGSSKPPVLNVNQGAPNTPPPPVLPSAPPPPPPPGGSPLAANNTTEDGTPAEAPNSSDQATSDMVASLEGGGSGSDGGGATVIIPGVLTGAPPPPPPPVDAASLPGFGNSSLWQ